MAEIVSVPSRLISASVPLPRWVDAMVLAANVAETYTVPATADFVLISSDVGFYINTNATATVPATEVTNGAASFYVPASIQIVVNSSDAVSLIATATAKITIGCYKR